MSNMVVAMCDVVQMCFVGLSIQMVLAAVAESVSLFTHCQAIQLSAMTNLVILYGSQYFHILLMPPHVSCVG